MTIQSRHADRVIHISETKATSNFADRRARAGAEVVIESGTPSAAVVRPAHMLLLSESLRLAKEHSSTATLDEDFAKDAKQLSRATPTAHAADMRLILDSSVLITAERQGQNARHMLTAISRHTGNTEIAVSVITLIEFAHRAANADTDSSGANLSKWEPRLAVIRHRPISHLRSKIL
jgi:hypothetical protein